MYAHKKTQTPRQSRRLTTAARAEFALQSQLQMNEKTHPQKLVIIIKEIILNYIFKSYYDAAAAGAASSEPASQWWSKIGCDEEMLIWEKYTNTEGVSILCGQPDVGASKTTELKENGDEARRESER